MKVYVGNLSFTMSDEDLKSEFSAFGEITEVTIIKDKFTGRSKGFGFITFKNSADAEKAIADMNGKDVQGRQLKVSEAKPMSEDRPRRSFDNRRRF